jgi:hypothetical protein
VKEVNGFSLEIESWLKPLTDLVRLRLKSRGYKKNCHKKGTLSGFEHAWPGDFEERAMFVQHYL